MSSSIGHHADVITSLVSWSLHTFPITYISVHDLSFEYVELILLLKHQEFFELAEG